MRRKDAIPLCPGATFGTLDAAEAKVFAALGATEYVRSPGLAEVMRMLQKGRMSRLVSRKAKLVRNDWNRLMSVEPPYFPRSAPLVVALGNPWTWLEERRLVPPLDWNADGCHRESCDPAQRPRRRATWPDRGADGARQGLHGDGGRCRGSGTCPKPGPSCCTSKTE